MEAALSPLLNVGLETQPMGLLSPKMKANKSQTPEIVKKKLAADFQSLMGDWCEAYEK
jgi:hypothetical protein